MVFAIKKINIPEKIKTLNPQAIRADLREILSVITPNIGAIEEYMIRINKLRNDNTVALLSEVVCLLM